MGSFFTALFDEMGARRRRLRAALGDRGQAIAEFLVLAGLALGSLGLFVREWMPAAAPWGFWMPAVFVVGYLAIDARRQANLARGAEPERTAKRFDWAALAWSFGCALIGAAAFVIAMSAEPQLEEWTPPEHTIPVDLSP
ncbi:MAG: hypothetical protein R3C16_08210 [Hyphomonadaceae bacterium]